MLSLCCGLKIFSIFDARVQKIWHTCATSPPARLGKKSCEHHVKFSYLASNWQSTLRLKYNKDISLLILPLSLLMMRKMLVVGPPSGCLSARCNNMKLQESVYLKILSSKGGLKLVSTDRHSINIEHWRFLKFKDDSSFDGKKQVSASSDKEMWLFHTMGRLLPIADSRKP